MTVDHTSSQLLLLARWYMTSVLLQAATLPATLLLLRRLPDGGAFFSKSIGITLTGFTMWWAWSAHLLANRSVDLTWGVALFGLLGWMLPIAWDRKSWFGLLRQRLRLLVASEVVFLIGFLALAAVRAWAPGVRHTEQPMDMMMLSSLWNSLDYPPQDAWLAGYPIGYYYLGYWAQILTGRLAGIGPDIGYNLGLATQFGILVTVLFGTGFNLVRSSPVAERRGAGMAWVGGLLAIVLTTLPGNFRSVHELLVRQPQQPGWWWASSRAIRDVMPDGTAVSMITEFPAFSYLLGDNHPHLHSSPLLLIVAALALSRILSASDPTTGRTGFRETSGLPWRVGEVIASLALSSVVVASVAATNSWEAPTALGLLATGSWVASSGNVGRRLIRTASETLIIAALALLLLTPLLGTMQGRVAGFLFNRLGPSNPLQFLSAMGPGFVAACTLILHLNRKRITWRLAYWVGAVGFLAAVATAFLVAVTPGGNVVAAGNGAGEPGDLLSASVPTLKNWAGRPLVVVGLMALIGVLLSRRCTPRALRANAGLLAAMILVLAGLTALLVPEWVYVSDPLGGRVNTVFKWHFSAWILFGPAGAYVIVRLAGKRRHALVLMLAALSTPAALFPFLAFHPITAFGNPGTWSLAAGSDLRETDTALSASLDWLIRNAPADAVVVESSGAAGEPLASAFSTYTGRPTLLGWLDHERQWRPVEFDAVFAERLAAIREIYETDSQAALSRILERFAIRYVIVGPREVNRFGPRVPSRALENSGVLVFASEPYQIYRMSAPPEVLPR